MCITRRIVLYLRNQVVQDDVVWGSIYQKIFSSRTGKTSVLSGYHHQCCVIVQEVVDDNLFCDIRYSCVRVNYILWMNFTRILVSIVVVTIAFLAAIFPVALRQLKWNLIWMWRQNSHMPHESFSVR